MNVIRNWYTKDRICHRTQDKNRRSKLQHCIIRMSVSDREMSALHNARNDDGSLNVARTRVPLGMSAARTVRTFNYRLAWLEAAVGQKPQVHRIGEKQFRRNFISSRCELRNRERDFASRLDFHLFAKKVNGDARRVFLRGCRRHAGLKDESVQRIDTRD